MEIAERRQSSLTATLPYLGVPADERQFSRQLDSLIAIPNVSRILILHQGCTSQAALEKRLTSARWS